MKLKKISALCLATLMVSTLTACGGTAKTDVSAEKGDANVEQENTTGEKQKVVAWAWDKNFNIAALEEAATLYEKDHPNVDVEIVEFAQADIVQKLNTSLSSGRTEGLPNIVLIEDYRSQTFLQAYPESFKDLTSIVNPDEFANYKLGFMTMNDKIYGVPFDTGTATLFYRKDIIEKAGYTEDDMKDLTWDKYIEIGKAVKEKTGVDMLTLDPNDIGQIRMMIQSAGSWYVKEDGKSPNFVGNTALKEGVNVYKTMVEAGFSKPISEWSQFVAAPNSGEVATVPTGCWFTPSIMGEESQSGLWRVAPLPRLANEASSVNASNLGGSSWYVLNDVKGSDEAMDFLGQTFAGSTELYQTILTKAGVIGTYLPAQQGEAYNQEVPFFGNQKIYAEISSWTKNIPVINYGLQTYAFEDIIKAEVQSVMSGVEIDKALESAQKQAETQIQ